MSFHPKMAYDATFHKSARQLEDEGPAFVVHAGEPRALRRDRHALSARAPPVGGAAGAVSRAVPAGLHHRERDPPRRRAARHHARRTSRTSCRSTRCSTRSRSGSSSLQVCRTLSCALNGAERVTEELQAKLGDQAGRDRCERHVHAARGRVPRRLRSRAGRDGQRRVARVPDAGGRGEARRRPPRARRGGAERLPSRGRARTMTTITKTRRARRTMICTEYFVPSCLRGFVIAAADMDPILTKHVREPNSFTLDFYLQHEGYDALKLALGDDARRGHRAGQGVRAARARRRGLPDRHEVAVRRQEDDARATSPATPTRASRARSRITC